MYTNYPVGYNFNNNLNPSYNNYGNYNDDRFLWAPFLFGGIAGTALGYGIASNNQYNNQPIGVYSPYPIQTYQSYPMYPTYSNNNNYFY